MQRPGQAHGHLGDAPGVALCFFVAQIQGVRPAFNSGVVGQGEFDVGALEAVEKLSTINGDGGLCNRWQEQAANRQ